MGLNLTTTAKTGWNASYASAEVASGGNWADRVFDGGSDACHGCFAMRLVEGESWTSTSSTQIMSFTGGMSLTILPSFNIAVMSITLGASVRTATIMLSAFTKHTTFAAMAAANATLMFFWSYADSSTSPTYWVTFKDDEGDAETITGSFVGAGTLPTVTGFVVGTTSNILPAPAHYAFAHCALGAIDTASVDAVRDDDAPWSVLTRTDESWPGPGSQAWAWGLRHARGTSFGDLAKTAGVEFDGGDEIALYRYAASGDRIAIPDPANVTIGHTSGSGAVSLSDMPVLFPVGSHQIEAAGDGTVARDEIGARSPMLARVIDDNPLKAIGVLFMGGPECFSLVGDQSIAGALAINTSPAAPDATEYPGGLAGIPQDLSGGLAAYRPDLIAGSLITDIPNAVYTRGTSDRETRVMADWGNPSAGSAAAAKVELTDTAPERDFARLIWSSEASSGCGRPIVIGDGDEIEILFHCPPAWGHGPETSTRAGILVFEYDDSVLLAANGVSDAGDSEKPPAAASGMDREGDGPSRSKIKTGGGYVDAAADLDTTTLGGTSYTIDTAEIHGRAPEVGDFFTIAYTSGDTAIGQITAYDADTGEITLEHGLGAGSATGTFHRAAWSRGRLRWINVQHTAGVDNNAWRGIQVRGEQVDGHGKAAVLAAYHINPAHPGWIIGSLGHPDGWDAVRTVMFTGGPEDEDPYPTQLARAFGAHVNIYVTSPSTASTTAQVQTQIEAFIAASPWNEHAVISAPTMPGDDLDEDGETAWRDLAETIGDANGVPWAKSYGLIGGGAYQAAMGFRGPGRRLSGLGAATFIEQLIADLAEGVTLARIEQVDAPAGTIAYAPRRRKTQAGFYAPMALVDRMIAQDGSIDQDDPDLL